MTESNGQSEKPLGEIASASKEQSTGIEQVSVAVTQMDQVTQTNAAGAEESASAAQELNAQSTMMRQSVQQLQQLVGGGNPTPHAAAAIAEPAVEAMPRKFIKPVLSRQTIRPRPRPSAATNSSAGNTSGEPVAQGASAHLDPFFK